ncbi:HAMP domain-containing protein [Gracilibacillus salitolerans]|uniref:HAMP domain-containing protein n=1 Tax=Gracilibacillus salitolerans TaxID=2663022 RepID=A0A5Q2TFD4_9BACI|nr:HAMP domain-containing methyl-accepting chemotaxis protein [Gracilibacillus salitolerans]QGH33366.1 HAMP domain-containing protein [Gracilibacillus salitolerans]
MKRFFENQKISTKLYAIVTLAVLVIVASSALFINTILSVSDQLEQQLYDDLYEPTFYLLNADRDFYQADQALITAILNEESQEEYKAVFEENAQQVEERMQVAEEILRNDEQIDQSVVDEHLSKFHSGFDRWRDMTVSIFQVSDTAMLNSLLENMRAEFDDTRNEIDMLQQEVEKTSGQILEEIETTTHYIVIFSVLIMLIFIIILFVLSFVLIRQVTKPISKLVDANEQVADGILHIDSLDDTRKDEIGSLARSTNRMIEELKSMVRHIQEISVEVNGQSRELSQASDEVNLGSQQIARTMEEMSNGAEEQASASSDISASIESLHRKIEASSEEGKTLQVSSNEVLELSVESGTQLNDSVEQMQEITAMMQTSLTKVQSLEQQSSKISTLIDVIQDIAEQTNLLALNAAIEAARAGDSGKGFAVVADEVRKLAEQVSSSVTEITDIIGGLQSETNDVAGVLEGGYSIVEKGNHRIQESHQSFQTIQSQMKDMIGRINIISTNLNDIQSSSEKVSDASTDIASTSEEVAAGIEESSATAEEQSASMQEIANNSNHLEKLSQDLNQLISKFKV